MIIRIDRTINHGIVRNTTSSAIYRVDSKIISPTSPSQLHCDRNKPPTATSSHKATDVKAAPVVPAPLGKVDHPANLLGGLFVVSLVALLESESVQCHRPHAVYTRVCTGTLA